MFSVKYESFQKIGMNARSDGTSKLSLVSTYKELGSQSQDCHWVVMQRFEG